MSEECLPAPKPRGRYLSAAMLGWACFLFPLIAIMFVWRLLCPG